MDKSFADKEKRLLKQLAAGSEFAFIQLFHAWRDKLYFFILRIVSNPETAEDVVQDVFVKLWQNRTNLAHIENFSAYLFRMAKNQAISGMRRMAQRTLILAELKRDAIAASLPEDDELLERQVYDKLKNIINHLPPRQKAIYTLSREEGLKQEDIARRLGISISTVQNHMTEALRTIKKQLKNHFPVALLCLLPLGIF